MWGYSGQDLVHSGQVGAARLYQATPVISITIPAARAHTHRANCTDPLKCEPRARINGKLQDPFPSKQTKVLSKIINVGTGGEYLLLKDLVVLW